MQPECICEKCLYENSTNKATFPSLMNAKRMSFRSNTTGTITREIS